MMSNQLFKKLATTFVVAFALVFIFYGLGFIVFPISLFEHLTGFALINGPASIDVRATYGGLSVAMGFMIFWVYKQPNGLRYALGFIVVAMLMMAFGRLVGFVVDGNPNSMMQIYLLMELGSAMLAVFLARKIAD